MDMKPSLPPTQAGHRPLPSDTTADGALGEVWKNVRETRLRTEAYAVHTEGRVSYTKSASAGTSLNRIWKTGFKVLNVSQFKKSKTD